VLGDQRTAWRRIGDDTFFPYTVVHRQVERPLKPLSTLNCLTLYTPTLVPEALYRQYHHTRYPSTTRIYKSTSKSYMATTL
jgi:hypothetical protein